MRPDLKVSTIIPVFGRHDVLRRAVASVLRQSHPVHEVIIVDDASHPPISDDDVGSSDARVRVIRSLRNCGPASARNMGIQASTGELIAFLDSDDVWYANKLEVQIHEYQERASRSKLSAIVCSWDVVHPGRPLTYSRRPLESAALEDFASGCWYSPGSTLLIERSAFDKIGLFADELRRLEDFEWFLRFAAAGGQLYSAPVVGAAIRHGRRAIYSEVRPAAAAILKRFDAMKSFKLSPPVSRKLRAWLHVELAAAARNEDSWGRLLWHLACSLCLVPRTSVEIKTWWTIGPPRGSELPIESERTSPSDPGPQ